MPNQHDHAIVIGASLAGMAQAAILRQFFKKVTIIERDRLDISRAADRAGVPHTRQVHALLNRGLENFEKFLPGLKQDLVDSGCVTAEFGSDIQWFMNGTWWSQVPSGVKAFSFSRGHFEFMVRQRLLREPNIHLRDGVPVTRFISNPEHTVIQGVEVTSGEKIYADLVVDCSGRHGQSLKWLEQLGIKDVPSTEVELNLCYTTQIFRIKNPPKWKSIYITVEPPTNSRQAILLPVEGGNYMLGLCGYFGDVPPRDREGITAFLQTLASPDMAKVFPSLIAVSEPVSYRFASNWRRHFCRVKNLPERLAFSGDVVCSFNPIYGQGMTTATLGAEVLQKCLERRQTTGLDGLTGEFQKNLEGVLNQPWMQVLTNDMRFAKVQGQRPPLFGFMSSYMHHLLSAMHLRFVQIRVVPILSMIASPLGLFTPPMMAIALLAKLGFIRPNTRTPALIEESFAFGVAPARPLEGPRA